MIDKYEIQRMLLNSYVFEAARSNENGIFTRKWFKKECCIVEQDIQDKRLIKETKISTIDAARKIYRSNQGAIYRKIKRNEK